MFRYAPRQIILHWAVVGLLLVQYLFNEPIGEAFDQWMREGQASMSAGVILHVLTGATILILVLWRIVLRRVSPAPPPAEGLPEKLATLVHAALYLVLILLPLSGSMAWFAGVEAAGETHEVLTSILLALAAIHVAGALYHQFVVKDDLMARMRLR